MNKWWPTSRSEHTSQGEATARATKDAQIDRVWKLTALPRAEFDLTYGALFANLFNYLAHAPSDSPTANNQVHAEALLSVVIDALRVRQSRIIPKHLPTEDVARVSELMSFALVVAIIADKTARTVGRFSLKTSRTSWCALLDPVPKDAEIVATHTVHPAFGSLLLGVLVGDAGLRWLCQEPVVIDELLRYFAGSPDSELRALSSGNVSLPKAAVAAATMTATDEHQVASSSAEPAAAKVALGWHYVTWVREQLDNKSMAANTATSFIHALDDNSAFLVVPEAFEAYAEERGVPIKRVQNQVKRLGLHRIQSHGKDLYRGTLAGRKVQGMIFKDAAQFWSHSPSPSETVEVRR